MHAHNDKFSYELFRNNYWPYPTELSKLCQTSYEVSGNENVNCSSIFPWPQHHIYLGDQPTWRPWTKEPNFGRSLDNSLQKIHEINGSKRHFHSQRQTNCTVLSSDNSINFNNVAHERRPLSFGHLHHPPSVLTNDHRNFNNETLGNKSLNLSKGILHETKHPQTININNIAEGIFTNIEKPPVLMPRSNFGPFLSNSNKAIYDNNLISSRLETTQIPRDTFSNRNIFCENNILFRHLLIKNYEEQCFGKPPPPYIEPTTLLANQYIRNNNFIQPAPPCHEIDVKCMNEITSSDLQSTHEDIIGIKTKKKLKLFPEPPKKLLKILPKPPEKNLELLPKLEEKNLELLPKPQEKNSDPLLELQKENSDKLPESSEKKFHETQQKDIKFSNGEVETLILAESDQKITNKINRRKLKLLIKYVQDDFIPCFSESPSLGNENVTEKTIINQTSNRRKLRKESIVKNKNNVKEMEVLYKNTKNSSSLGSQISEKADANITENKMTQKRINGKRKGEFIHPGTPKSKRCSNSVKDNKDDNDENKEVNKLTIKISDKMHGDVSDYENSNKLTINKIEGDFQNCQICHLELPRDLLWINAMSGIVKCINCCIKSKSAEFALLKKAILM